MSRSTVIIATVVVLAASAAIVGWSFFGLGTRSPTINTSPQKNQEVTNQPIVEKKFKSLLPIGRVYLLWVKGAIVWYTFTGTVKGIGNNGKNIELLTDLTEPEIPQFLVTPKTPTFLLKNGQKIATSSTSLQTNQKVDILIPFDLKQKVWDNIKEISILNP